MTNPEVWRKCLELLGERVKAIRVAKGLTQYDVVRHSEVHPSHLSKIEHGSNITVESLLNIAQLLGVPACDLLAGMPEVVMKPKRGRKQKSGEKQEQA